MWVRLPPRALFSLGAQTIFLTAAARYFLLAAQLLLESLCTRPGHAHASERASCSGGFAASNDNFDLIVIGCGPSTSSAKANHDTRTGFFRSSARTLRPLCKFLFLYHSRYCPGSLRSVHRHFRPTRCRSTLLPRLRPQRLSRRFQSSHLAQALRLH